MSIILFLAVLFVLILVHELGHFVMAKKTGMRVDEFGIGFPPKLHGIKKGDTEYTINALPIGGFVKIYGENYEDMEKSKVPGVVLAGSFTSKSRWAQALVLVAGVTMNVLFAWFLFSLTYMIGVPTAVDEATASDSAQLYIAGVLADSPASSIPPGSVVTAIEHSGSIVENPSPSEFTSVVSKAAADTIIISYNYDQADQMISIEPVQGLIEAEPERYAVGASLSLVENQKRPFFTAIGDGFVTTWKGLVGISVGLGSLISQAVTGEADFSQVAGPVGIVGMVGDAAAFGLTALLTFTAIISLNLAVINLLPFPALDGGRLLFVVIEGIARRRIPPEWAGRLNLAGFAILMLLMIAVTYNDILRLL